LHATLLNTADPSLRERAFQALKERILRGEIPSGTVLTETRVAKSLGMSRTPVREALVRLTHEGFAQRFPGRGVIVLELSVKDIIDVIDVQGCLEQYAIQRVFESGRRFQVPELRDLLRRQRQAVAARDTRDFLQHDRRMHYRIVEHVENSRLCLIMENASDLLVYGGYRALGNEAKMQETLREHEAIIDALEAQDARAAVDASRLHIEGAKRRLLS
jgi:DNA-binding GntR family transcriptional regulator